MPKYYNKVPFIKKTDADWTSLNPILMDGEIILVTGEDEIVRLKVGDGVSNYSELDYISDGASTYGTRMKIGDGVSTYSNLRFVTFAKGSVTQEQFAELLTLIEDTNLRIDGNDESIDKIEQNLSTIEELAKTLRSDLDNISEEVSQQLDTALTGINDVSNRLTNLESSVEETSNVFREKLTQHDKDISDIFSRVDGLKNVNDSLSNINSDITLLSNKVDKNILDISNIDNRVAILETNGGGSSVDNEELLDIRKGYNNIIYDKAGDAVRALGNELSSLKINPNDLGLTIEGGIVYPTYKNKASIHGVKIEGSGGGGVVNPEYLFVIKNEMEAGDTFSVSYGETVTLDYTFTSLDPFTYQPTGNGTASYHVNSNQVAVQTVKQGFNSFDCTKYLAEGNNTVTVTIKNSYGESKSFTWNIKCISVRLSSAFNYDYINTKNYFSFRYTVYGEDIKKDVHFILDGVKDNEVKTVESSGETFSKTFENLSHGVHTLEVYAIGYVNGEEIRSNTLKYDIIIALSGETTPIISINCEQSSIQEGELVKIPYVVYDPQNTQSNATLEIHQLINGVYELYHKETRTVTSALQYWNTRQYPVGDVKFTVSLGNISRSIIISIEKADFQISAIETDLELYLSSNGRSNSQENRDVWEYKGKEGTITTDFNNVTWSSSSGWVIDDNGDTCLRLQSGSTATINFKPFTNVTTFGKTIEFEFAIKNINNRNASVISCVQNGRGVNITADSAILTSNKLKSYCHISDERKIRVSFTIEALREKRMMSIYLDGVLTTCTQYSDDDVFDHTEYITIGSPDGYCTIDLYTVRVYSFALSQRNIITNYISDIADLTEKKNVYLRNNIYDSSMNLDYAKVKNQIPVMTITGTLPPEKGQKQTVHITYEDPFDSSMNFTDWQSTIDVQGTSSQYYVRKNYKIKLPQKYAHIKGGVETKTYCMKADYAEATSTHNTQNANIIHTLYDTKTPAQEIHPNCRTTIQGFPCVIYHKSSMESKPTFLGKYNFNFDKGSEEVFFGQPEDNLVVESWEFCNNDTDACNFRGNIPEKYDEVVVENGISTQKGWCKTFERRYPDNKLIEEGTENYRNESIANFRRMHDWVVSTQYMNLENSFQLKEYRTKFEEIFDLDKMLTYYVWTFFFLMVDQRAKNMFMTYWGKTGKWEPWFYDNDTCLGINNEGALVYDYYHEDTDTIDVVSTTGETVSTNVFNGQDSKLWTKFSVAYAKEIQEKYRSLRSTGKLTYNKIRNQFVTEGSDKWSETIYNEDSDFKYISMLRENNNATYLPQIKGTGEHHLDYFLDARLNYCDSKWNSAGYTNEPNDKGYAQNYILLRINTPTTYGDVVPNQDITIVPFSDMYAGIKYNSSGTLMQKRVKKGEKCKFSAPANSIFNDFDTLIFGASQISEISDLAPLYCHFCDVASATKLISLTLGSKYPSYTSKLDSINLGANKLLKYLDVRHCNSLINPLNLVECDSIETVLAEGSSISGMDLGESGYLKKVHLPSTVVSLKLKNQNYIEEFTMEAYVNITTLNIENTQNIPIKDIILAEPKECRYLDFTDSENKVKYGLRSSALERVRLMNVNFSATEDELRRICDKLKTCKGIDENGLNIDKAIVNGIVNVESITREFLIELNTVFPELMVCENGKNLCAVSYYNHGSTEPIYVAIVEQGSNAPDIVANGELGYIPSRPETEDYRYEFRGWEESLENVQKNMSVRAKYDTYYAVKFMNGETELHKEYVLGGGSATDPLQNNTISTPIKESTAQYDFKFIGWDKEFSNVVDVTYVNAVFSETIRSYMITFYNETTVLESKLVNYGTIPEYTGETPLKQGVSYPQDYKFKGWTPELEAVTDEASYYADFYESDHILDSWYEVANSVQDGTYKEKYELGSLHRFILTTGEMVEVELVGYDHDVTEDGKVCGLTFITKSVLNKQHIMINKNEPNTASWINSLIRKYLETDVLPYLPPQINDVIVPVVKTTHAGNNRQYTIDTIDKIWLPSVYELAESKNSYSGEGKTYEFFKTKENEFESDIFYKRVRFNADGIATAYWTRSPTTSYTYRYWSIKYTGETHILSDGWEEKGIVFGFCIGKKN